MNVRRGLWRSWIFPTVLWVIGIASLAYMIMPDSVASRKYQYVYHMRSDVPDPNQSGLDEGLLLPDGVALEGQSSLHVRRYDLPARDELGRGCEKGPPDISRISGQIAQGIGSCRLRIILVLAVRSGRREHENHERPKSKPSPDPIKQVAE
jgi:hypothetical protein